MRTVSTTAIIKQALGKLSTYPEGSISRRDVIAEIPCSGHDEKLERRLNAALTKTVYDNWKKASLEKPKAFSDAQAEITKLVQAALDKLANKAEL